MKMNVMWAENGDSDADIDGSKNGALEYTVDVFSSLSKRYRIVLGEFSSNNTPRSELTPCGSLPWKSL